MTGLVGLGIFFVGADANVLFFPGADEDLAAFSAPRAGRRDLLVSAGRNAQLVFARHACDDGWLR